MVQNSSNSIWVQSAASKNIRTWKNNEKTQNHLDLFDIFFAHLFLLFLLFDTLLFKLIIYIIYVYKIKK